MLKKISEEQRKIAGITIIALTVSIVILIILAGISTNLILGKNGLIKRAQEAKDKSEDHSKNEEIERQELYNAWAGGTSGGTVVKRAHLINPASDVMYDGTEHKWIPKLKNDLGDVLVEGTDYTVSYSTTDFTNVTGIIKVVITGKGIYKQTLTQSYEITKRPATFTSASVERPYTGEALTCDKIEMEGILEKDKDKISFEVTGSQADIGNSANGFTYQFSDKTIEKNYKITVVVGTLSVIGDRVPTTPTVPKTNQE